MKKLVIILSILILCSIMFFFILEYKKSEKDKYYKTLILNIEKKYMNAQQINSPDKNINKIYDFYNKSIILKNQFNDLKYDNFISSNDLINIYKENNISDLIDKNIISINDIKKELIFSYDIKNLKPLITEEKEVIWKNINKEIFNKNINVFNEEYSNSIGLYNVLKEFIDNTINNKDKWKLLNGKLIVKNEEYKKYLDEKNKEFNINISTELEILYPQIPIFMYHGVNNITWGISSLFQKEEDFEKQMKYLYDNNYETIFLSEIKNYKDYSKKVILTFDDAYEDFYRIAFPILSKYKLKSNLFVISDFLGDKYITKDQLIELSSSPLIEIGSHTVTHAYLPNISLENIELELQQSKIKLESIIKKQVDTFAYPVGGYNTKIVNITKKYYKYAVTTNEGIASITPNTSYYTLKRIRLNRGVSLNSFIDYLKESR